MIIAKNEACFAFFWFCSSPYGSTPLTNQGRYVIVSGKNHLNLPKS